ncbi:MAG: hypothetical protein SNG34_04575 [Rikenellaceae bacterium]
MSLSRSIIPLLLLLLMGCNKDNILSKVVEVDPEGWLSPAVLHFEVDQSWSGFDMELIMRCVQLTGVDSVELMVSTTTPDGVLWNEPFTLYPISDGQDVEIVEIPYRTSIEWSQEGRYTLSIQPLEAYKGITAVGANIIFQDK